MMDSDLRSAAADGPVSWHSFAFGAIDLSTFLSAIRSDIQNARSPKIHPMQLLRLFLDEVLRKGTSRFGMTITTCSVAAITDQLAGRDWKAVNARCRALLAFACRTVVELELGLTEVCLANPTSQAPDSTAGGLPDQCVFASFRPFTLTTCDCLRDESRSLRYMQRPPPWGA